MQLAEWSRSWILVNEAAGGTIVDAKANHQCADGVAAFDDCFALVDSVGQIERLHLVANRHIRQRQFHLLDWKRRSVRCKWCESEGRGGAKSWHQRYRGDDAGTVGMIDLE